jgi:tellurite methyltransferase
MDDLFAKNIHRYRKERNLTQEEFSKLIGISFQAVSKWERGYTMPDIALLPKISKILKVSLDKLFGYPYHEKSATIYDEQYKTTEYYWGVVPSRKCFEILSLYPPTKQVKFLHIIKIGILKK